MRISLVLILVACQEPSSYPVVSNPGATKSKRKPRVVADWYKRRFAQFPRSAWISRDQTPYALVAEDAKVKKIKGDFIAAPVIEERESLRKLRVVLHSPDLRVAVWVDAETTRPALTDRTYFAGGALLGVAGLAVTDEVQFIDQGVRLPVGDAPVGYVFNGPPLRRDALANTRHYYRNAPFYADPSKTKIIGRLNGELSAKVISRRNGLLHFEKKTGYLRGKFWAAPGGPRPYRRGIGSGYGRVYKKPAVKVQPGDCLRVDGEITALVLKAQSCSVEGKTIQCYLKYRPRTFDRKIERKCVGRKIVDKLLEDHDGYGYMK